MPTPNLQPRGRRADLLKCQPSKGITTTGVHRSKDAECQIQHGYYRLFLYFLLFPSCPNVLLAFVTQLCLNGLSTELCQSGCILIYLYFNAVNTHYFQYSWRRTAILSETMLRPWYGRCSISHWLSSWALSQKPARLCSYHPSQVNPLLAQKSSSNLSSNVFSAGNHICSGPNTIFSVTSPLLHRGTESHHSHISLGFPGLTDQVPLASPQTHGVLSLCHRNPPLHLGQRQPPDPCHRTHHLNTKFPYLHWALFQEGICLLTLVSWVNLCSALPGLCSALPVSSFSPVQGQTSLCFTPFLFLPSKGVLCCLRMTSWSFSKLMANGNVMALDTWPVQPMNVEIQNPSSEWV